MTPEARRWALLEDGSPLASPEACRQARGLEAHGYVQHDFDELSDGQRMIFLCGHDGSAAPGVYHRYGTALDHQGIRDEHVLEAYPESPYATRLAAQGAQHVGENGNPVPRVAFFIGDKPEHNSHFAQFYNERDRMHRAEAGEE